MLLLFDTNTYTSYKQHFAKNDHAHLAMSIVIWYELTATTLHPSDLQAYEGLRHTAAAQGRLFTPTMSDWREAAKVVARLRFADKRAGHGKTPALSDATALQNDALIARAAFIHKCTVVTTNLKDFERLRHHWHFGLLDAADYFK